jgi:hypothetical protein
MKVTDELRVRVRQPPPQPSGTMYPPVLAMGLKEGGLPGVALETPAANVPLYWTLPT